jgi:hypothetical protein
MAKLKGKQAREMQSFPMARITLEDGKADSFRLCVLALPEQGHGFGKLRSRRLRRWFH